METAIILLRQIVTMFIYMAIGWILFKTKLVTKEGSRSLASLLLYVIIPCVIIKSFCTSADASLKTTILVSFGGGILALGLSILISHVLFHNRPMDDFGAAFSNAGFMGLPLISAALGDEAVIYVTGMIAILNILQWTYGQTILSHDKSNLSLKKVIFNPIVIAFLIGIVIFFGNLSLPALIMDCMESISELNAPLAMIVLGIYLGEVSLPSIFTDKHVWTCSLVRLLLIPLLTELVLFVLFPGRRDMAFALVLAASAPVGANLAVYAQKLNQDYTYAVKTICLSTILSICTMPFLTIVWEWLCR